MNNTITILTDNNADLPLISEHGYSMLLETENKRILFDTGQGNALFLNAENLGIPLSGLDILVLSHGHYDHGGNLAQIIELNPSIQFFAHPDCLVSRYSCHEGTPPKYAGLSEEHIKTIKDLPPEQLHWCREKTEIAEGIFITGTVPRNNEFEDTGGSFYLDRNKNEVDYILDDISLWIEKKNQITVLCGCCHSGLQNTIEYILSLYSRSIEIQMVIGGLHLLHAGQDRINKTISFIQKRAIRKLIGSHCSGEKVMKLLTDEMPETVAAGSVGMSFPF